MADQCPHHTTVLDGASTICTGCGLVLEDFLPDQYSFADYERCSGGAVDVKGSKKKIETARMLINSYTCLLHMSDALNDTAMQIFEDSVDSTILLKKKMEVRCAACVYCAAKLQGFDRSEEEIAASLECNRKEFRQCMVSMRASLVGMPYGVELMTTVSAERLVQRMLDRLHGVLVRHGINRNVVLQDFYKHIHGLETTKGKKPQNVCAAILCHILRQTYGVSIQEVSDTLQISSIYISADIR